MNITPLSQRDPRWSNLKVGYSSSTIGEVGCLFMDYLMLVCHDRPFDPAWVAAHMACLKEHGVYTRQGGAYVQSPIIAPCMPAEWGKVTWTSDSGLYNLVDFPAIKLFELKKWLISGQTAILEVDPLPGTPGVGDGFTHFVLASGLDANGNILINDPWYGDYTTLCPRYGATHAYAIYRAIYYEVTRGTPSPPPVISNAGHKLGLNCIHNSDGALGMAALGCRAITLLDHPDVVLRLASEYPDMVVVNRRWSPDPLNGVQQWQKFGASELGVNEIYNEQDGRHDYGDVQSLRFRIDEEFQYADLARGRGANVALGGYSMGTPDYTNPRIIEQMKRYAARYNTDAGIYFSLHNYSPKLDHIKQTNDLKWYERRWEFLFSDCGFDPTLRKIIVSETGLDEGGVGGFKAHNNTAQEFADWCMSYNNIISAPLVLGGRTYPSPVIASTIFAYTGGNDRAWDGYDVSGYQDRFKEAGITTR